MRRVVALDEPQQVREELMAALQDANHHQPLLGGGFHAFQVLVMISWASFSTLSNFIIAIRKGDLNRVDFSVDGYRLSTRPCGIRMDATSRS